jgi:uncharacterized protein (UPF0332 family)
MKCFDLVGREIAVATWREMSRECLEQARILLKEGPWRGSISRSYYAAYCAVTSDLVERGLGFAHGWNNPGHDQLPQLVLHNTTWPHGTRYRVNRSLRRLRNGREDADYRPGAAIGRQDAVDLFRDADTLIQTLEDLR